MDLQDLTDAIAAQLKANIARSTHFYGQPVDLPSHPNITIEPGSTEGRAVEYSDTFGRSFHPGAGEMTLRFTLRLEVMGKEKDAHVALYDYLSTGSTSRSSVIRAVDIDPTFGGLVDSAVISGADIPPSTEGPLTALFPLTIQVNQQ